MSNFGFNRNKIENEFNETLLGFISMIGQILESMVKDVNAIKEDVNGIKEDVSLSAVQKNNELLEILINQNKITNRLLKKLTPVLDKKLPADYRNYLNKNILVKDCDENEIETFLSKFEITNNKNIIRNKNLDTYSNLISTLTQAGHGDVVFLNLSYRNDKIIKNIESLIKDNSIKITFEDSSREISLDLPKFFFIIYTEEMNFSIEEEALFDFVF